MTLHAAFLRGINLGRRRISMDRLRETVEAFGLADVATFIASGNVVFRNPGRSLEALERSLEFHLESSLGYPVATFVRPFERLRELAASSEIAQAEEEEGFTAHVLFLRGPAPAGVAERFDALAGPDDRFLVRGAEVVWLRRGGLSDGTIAPADLDRAVGVNDHSLRKLTTLQRMLVKFDR
jgi:uncharacterized protein (DUF1697 family)